MYSNFIINKIKRIKQYITWVHKVKKLIKS